MNKPALICPLWRSPRAARLIAAAMLPPAPARCRIVLPDGRQLTGPCRAHAYGPSGSCLALIGSTGRLEIAVRDGSAAASLGLQRQDRFTLQLL